MRYVVTGASGFIGSHLTETLEQHGHDVDAVDLDRDITIVPLDLAGIDGIFHLAGQPGVRSSWADFRTYVDRNVLATQLVFQAAAAAGVRVVYASSSSVYGDAETYPTSETVLPRPVSPYGVTKLACEHLAHAFTGQGLDAVGLRYFTVYGPGQRPDMAFARIFNALATDTPFSLFGDGRAYRSFTYVADAVDATIKAMEHGSSPVYNIGGGYETSMDTAIRLAEEVAGRGLRVDRQPSAPGDARRTSADVTLARVGLGWEPTTVLPDGMAAQWEHVAMKAAA
jgi:nucleoside-diphosphate-sugar epimerase